MSVNGDSNAADSATARPVVGSVPDKKRYIVRDNKNTNSALKKKTVKEIKDFFMHKNKVDKDGKLLSVPFHKILGVLKIYKGINDKLLSDDGFINYYTDQRDQYNRKQMKGVVKKLFSNIDNGDDDSISFHSIPLFMPQISSHIKGDNIDTEKWNTYLEIIFEKYLYSKNDTSTKEEKEKMIEFLMNIFKAKGNINKITINDENPIILFEPISYDSITKGAWKSLNNNNKPLHFYGELNNNNYQDGGYVSLSTDLGKTTVMDYSRRCYGLEILYYKKHYEYLKLFTILYDLVKLTRKLVTANQSLLRTKIYDKDGNIIDIHELTVRLPKNIIDIDKAISDQSKIIAHTQKYMKKKQPNKPNNAGNNGAAAAANNGNVDPIPSGSVKAASTEVQPRIEDNLTKKPRQSTADKYFRKLGNAVRKIGKRTPSPRPAEKMNIDPAAFESFGTFKGGGKSKKISIKKSSKINSKKVKKTNRNKQHGGVEDTLSNNGYKKVSGLKPITDKKKEGINKIFELLKEGQIKPKEMPEDIKKTSDKIKFYNKKIYELHDQYIKNNRMLTFKQSGGKIITDPKELQRLLDKCYNLEQLYAMKHYEVMEIMKPIIYYYNAIAIELIIMMFILNLYHDDKVVDDDEFEELFTLNVEHEGILDDLDDLLENQHTISKTLQDLHEESEHENDGHMDINPDDPDRTGYANVPAGNSEYVNVIGHEENGAGKHIYMDVNPGGPGNGAKNAADNNAAADNAANGAGTGYIGTHMNPADPNNFGGGGKKSKKSKKNKKNKKHKNKKHKNKKKRTKKVKKLNKRKSK